MSRDRTGNKKTEPKQRRKDLVEFIMCIQSAIEYKKLNISGRWYQTHTRAEGNREA